MGRKSLPPTPFLLPTPVVSLHVKEEVPTEKGGIDMTKALPILFSPGSREYWSLGRPLGHYGFTKGKP